ncbi:gliding motility-associated C-terminal domain-containing protein [Prolixibacter sp. SD074]|jgi:gliding motility-associated-like protein|uniref:T9SS type B sorting domain-containing protein n=1 Tax=Prolixibacter sp. SD074 TaxID=2652391 RepID=UPI00127867AC|nr:gliding motility-associated C-terminal domain-containing protein [Prolixibacter sp. SD074]GET31054.1 hypothetical protein SD074_32560 [Prolixibacter sp. SD074]
MQINPLIIKVCLVVFFVPGMALLTTAQQLNAPASDFSERTSYPVTPNNDMVYYFCTQQGQQIAELQATSAGSVVTFNWTKYNSATGSFDAYATESGASSVIQNLADGCYQVSFTDGGNNYSFRSWVFNSWLQVTAAVTASTCSSFHLESTVTGSTFIYYDISSNQQVVLAPNDTYAWYDGGSRLSTQPAFTMYDVPAQNTDYRLEVTNRAGCAATSTVTYQSVVPEAKFSWTTSQKSDPQYSNPQAPLDVQFNNESINADNDKFEWFLFRDISAIREEASTTTQPVDSIMEVLAGVNPVYTYENSGRYMVKLVAAKENPNFTCRDTFYLSDYIVVDTSLVMVPPVFTPNGDGMNDVLKIETRSLESLDFQVLNRWGRTVHHFKKSGYIPEDSELAAWDGKIGGKPASAGVYFFVIDAVGRDGTRRKRKGFIHLLR